MTNKQHAFRALATRLPLLILTCAALGASAACIPPQEVDAHAAAAGVDAAAAAFSEADVRSTIRFLSDDLLEGRGPATHGDAIARAYLASRLEGFGYEPGGPDGSWEQPFDIVGINATVPDAWTFSGHGQQKSFKVWDEFIAASGVQTDTASIDGAEVVFVGYGIQAPEYEWDDLKGADLAGKVLLMLNNDPDWDPELFEGKRRLYYGRWTYKYESAARQGAVGAIIVHTTPSAGYPFQVVQSSWTGEQFELPAGDEPRAQIEAWLTEEAAGQLVAMAGKDLGELVEAAKGRDFQPVPLGITTSLSLTNALSRVTTANVAGLLRGSDPELADEVVVYTAHHDHLGINKPNDAGDEIYNGARDNASGVAQVLAAAKAFAALPEPPRRSILILLVAAEEQGLLGSAFYARHPTFPPGRIAANVNLDGANIWGRTKDAVFIGYGKSASLDAVVERHAAAQERTVVGDQLPDRGYFYRSDQFNFAKIGVPAIYLDNGVDFVDRPAGWGEQQIEAWEAAHYHQASDEIEDDWNYEGMLEDARLAFEAGLEIAHADQAPTWNPGDEFEAARNAALAELGE